MTCSYTLLLLLPIRSQNVILVYMHNEYYAKLYNKIHLTVVVTFASLLIHCVLF